MLIVEDDGDLQSLLGEILRDAGYSVFSAHDGASALAYVRRFIRPDLILLDLNMPGMSGKEFREEQLEDPELAAIPVVVVSGEQEALRKARELRPARVLRKPFTVEALLEVLEHVLPHQPVAA